MAENAKSMEEMEQKWADRLEEAERKNKVRFETSDYMFGLLSFTCIIAGHVITLLRKTGVAVETVNKVRVDLLRLKYN